jgi:hypothetical protein
VLGSVDRRYRNAVPFRLSLDAEMESSPALQDEFHVKLLGIALRPGVFVGHALRHTESPGVLDKITHLVRVDSGETDVGPVVAKVELARQRELLRLRLDERVAPLLGECESP